MNVFSEIPVLPACRSTHWACAKDMQASELLGESGGSFLSNADVALAVSSDSTVQVWGVYRIPTLPCSAVALPSL